MTDDDRADLQFRLKAEGAEWTPRGGMFYRRFGAFTLEEMEMARKAADADPGDVRAGTGGWEDEDGNEVPCNVLSVKYRRKP